MAWTTALDVIDSWIGPDAPDDAGLIDKWIGRAERLVRREFPDLQARMDKEDEPDLPDIVVDVVVAMVARVFRNPSGHRSVSGQETTGQFSGSNTITYGGNNPGALELLDSERDMLGGGAVPTGAFEVDMMDGSPGPSMVPRWDGWW